MTWPGRMRGHSGSIGSFTFTIRSALAQTVAASGAICAPAARYSASPKPLPCPAPVSTMTAWPSAASVAAPEGTSATRFSLVLISFGMPIFMCASVSYAIGAGANLFAHGRMNPALPPLVNLLRKPVQRGGDLHRVSIRLLQPAQRLGQAREIGCGVAAAFLPRPGGDARRQAHHRLQQRLARLCIPFDGDDIRGHASVGTVAAVDLLAPRPGLLAFGTLAARLASIFLQLVGAVEIGHVARRVHARADAEAVHRRARGQHVAQQVFVEVAAGEDCDMIEPARVEDLPHLARMIGEVAGIDAHALDADATALQV